MTGEGPEHPPGPADGATGRQARGIDDSTDKAAQIRAALAEMYMEDDPETWQRITPEVSVPGSPDALETVGETATTVSVEIHDAAASDRSGAAFFRELLSVAQRAQVEFTFDWTILDGIRDPSVMVMIAVELARGFSRLHAHTREGREVQTLVTLLQQHPAQALSYAAERVATFDTRYGDAP